MKVTPEAARILNQMKIKNISKKYVNAKKNSGENLFKYGESDNSEEELYQLALQNLEVEEEQCLTFTLDESENLVAAGVDCQSKIKPLCLQITPENLDFVPGV